jgi:hypothetical protein
MMTTKRIWLASALLAALALLIAAIPFPAPPILPGVLDNTTTTCASGNLPMASAWPKATLYVWNTAGTVIVTCWSNSINWIQVSGGGGGGCGAGLVASGTGCAVNFAAVVGVAGNQSGVESYCHSTNGTTAYTCSLANGGTNSAALTEYTPGMVIHLVVDTPSLTTASLAVDSVNGGTPVTLDDATCGSEIGTGIAANQMYDIWYNGTVFCLKH